MSLAYKEGRTFDARRHSILQSELKCLYVGLTRARERVWIWEESSEGHVMEVMDFHLLRVGRFLSAEASIPVPP